MEFILNQIAASINSKLRNIPWLNSGGCGVAAAKLGEELAQKFPNYRIDIVSVGSRSRFSPASEQYDENESYNHLVDLRNRNIPFTLTEINECGAFVDHMYVRVTTADKVFFIDSNGIQETKEFPTNRINFVFTIEEVKRMASDASGWNDLYNRAFNAEVESHITEAIQETLIKNNIKS